MSMRADQALEQLERVMGQAILSLRIEVSSFSRGEVTMEVNRGTPAEVKIGPDVLLAGHFLAAVMHEARRALEQQKAKSENRHFYVPPCRCGLCGYGPEQYPERVAEYARTVLRITSH